MARLVARALRLGRSALIQVGAGCVSGRYRLSYLAPALVARPVILVATESVQQRLLRVEIPHTAVAKTNKRIRTGYAGPMPISRDCYHHPEAWLAASSKIESSFHRHSYPHRWCG